MFILKRRRQGDPQGGVIGPAASSVVALPVAAPLPGAAADRADAYVSAEGLRELLACVLLLQGARITGLAESGDIIQKRQNVPPDAYWDAGGVMDNAEKEERRVQEGEYSGSHAYPMRVGEDTRFLFAASYRWLEPSHPDKAGHHLRVISRVLQKYGGGKGKLAALFWDFPCLPQEPRTTEEDDLFRRGLGFLNILYGHNLTTIIQQMWLPAGFEGPSYEQSGWCTYESTVTFLFLKVT